jgi:hypothetical protein
MKRVLACVLIASLGIPSVSFAGETLLESATRVARKVVRAEPPAKPVARPVAHFQQTPRGLESSGLRTRSKLLIALGVAAGFVGIALAIDSRVEDVTPSTKGERINEPF